MLPGVCASKQLCSFAKITDFTQQMTDTMIHTRINDRIKLRKIHIKGICTFHAFIDLNVPYFAKESRRLPRFNGMNHFTFIDPSTRIQNRHIDYFSSANSV